MPFYDEYSHILQLQASLSIFSLLNFYFFNDLFFLDH